MSDEPNDDDFQPQQRRPHLCPLCSHTFVSLKLLPSCGHAYCSTCLHTLVIDSPEHAENTTSGRSPAPVNCPICQQQISIRRNEIDYLPTDDYFESLLSSVDRCEQWPRVPADTKPVSCSVCPDDRGSLASWWCAGCSQFLCERCVGVHGKGSTTKTHRVDAITDLALRQTANSEQTSSTRNLAKLNERVTECENELEKQTEIGRQSDAVKREILAEHDELRRLIDGNRDELTGELDDLTGTAERDVRRHLAILKCFLHYCAAQHSSDVDGRIDDVIEQFDADDGGSLRLPVGISGSILVDGMLAASFKTTGVRDYLPRHIHDNVIGKLVIGSTADEDVEKYKTWDEQDREIADQSARLEELQRQLVECTRQLTDTRNVLASNVEQTKKLEHQLAASHTQTHEVEDSLAKSKTQVGSLKEEMNRLSADKSALQNQNQSLENDKRELMAAQKRLSETKSKLNDELCLMKQANAKLFEERDALEKDLVIAERTSEDREHELAQYRERELLQTLQLDEARERERELCSQLRLAEERECCSKQLNEDVERRVRELEAQLEHHSAQSQLKEDDLKHSLDAANDARADLELQVCELLKERDRLRSETYSMLKESHARSADAQKQIRSAAEHDKMLQQELDKRRKREDELMMQLRDSSDREQSSAQRVRELESHVQQLADERLGPTAVPVYELHGLVTVHGMASLDHEFYIARASSTQIEVYSSETFALQRHLVIKSLLDVVDMTACARYRCLYVADGIGGVVHRVELTRRRDHAVPTSWSVGDKPYGLSVTSLECHVLVTCRESSRLKQFTTHGQLVRQVLLDPALQLVGPRHAVQLTTGQFVVCHGAGMDSVNRVCVVSSDGRRVAISFGGGHLLDWPTHVAVDRRHGYVYVADYNNKRVIVLNDDLVQVGELAAGARYGLRSPRCLCYDADNRRLYVGESGGRVVVYAVNRRAERRVVGLTTAAVAADRFGGLGTALGEDVVLSGSTNGRD